MEHEHYILLTQISQDLTQIRKAIDYIITLQEREIEEERNQEEEEETTKKKTKIEIKEDEE